MTNEQARASPAEAVEMDESQRERARQLQAVADLGARALSGVPLQDTLDEAVSAVADCFGVEYAKILELLPNGSEVFLVAGVGWQDGLVGHARVSTGLDSQAGYTLGSKHPVLVDDLRAETRFSGPALLHQHEVVSGVSVTIPGLGGRPYGVFGAHTKRRRHFTKDDAAFLQAVANVVASAVAKTRSDESRDLQSVLEHEVSERTLELQGAVDDLEAFNAMVAHDLREPIRSVTSLGHMLSEDYDARLDDTGRRVLANLIESAVGMRHLVDDLLAFSRARQTPLAMEDVDVSALADAGWRRQMAEAPARRVEFVVEQGLTARADPHLLEVVLDNLLGNALKFTRHIEKPVVEVGSTHLEAGGTAFYVRDNGAGFAPENAEVVFHAFKRLHSPQEFEGSGIGLATVKRIVERHGGRVWAHSAGEGKGATLFFRLFPAGLP